MPEMPVLKNKIRTLSGVTPVAILTKPWACPGKCIFCPHEDVTPQSYLSKEPAVQRALLNEYDAAGQVDYRLRQYKDTGHPVDKIELIILGGSWSSYPLDYREDFIKGALQTLNKSKSKDLKSALLKNEKAQHRMIGLTIETRPDLVTEKEIKHLRLLGVTKVELGVQTTDERILNLNRRGHGVSEIVHATKLLKDNGFKVLYHMMPGLYGSDMEKDVEMFEELFSNERFQPDMLKIYPCVVIPGTDLYALYNSGKYTPYSHTELIELMISIKTKIPAYVRIMRLYRDIPAEYIEGGSITSNLREIVQRSMKERDLSCTCIRCREIRMDDSEKDLKINRIEYPASGGKEIFLQFIDSRDRLYALLRLRIPSNIFTGGKHLFPVLENCAIIRELHVYGKSIPLEEKGVVQHTGLGKVLMREAEKIVRDEYNLSHISVISGIGVRSYYRKLGYELKDSYMVKVLR